MPRGSPKRSPKAKKGKQAAAGAAAPAAAPAAGAAHQQPHNGDVVPLVDAHISFPAEEQSILEHWNETKAFEEQLRLTEGKPEYTFYDGPPFATGLPHYGHILAGTIKDVVTRYASQTGYHVNRRFGWDCHGLPVEFEIDKKLGITSKEQVYEMGIAAYNEECRSIVTRYCSEWETIVNRLGRWIDFENDYKTMEPWYMESVWWVFQQLFEKDLVYRGYKVMPYSTACTTPLSNFEANLNYKDASDPAVVVAFPLEEDPSVLLLAWTTTPWTLPSNLALCVNADMDYVKVRDVASDRTFVMAEECMAAVYPGLAKKKYKGGEFEVLEKFKGETLRGKRYTPLFEYFRDRANEHTWTVQVDGYVAAGTGTGIVHQAPAFGEDDFRVCLAGGVCVKGEAIVCPVDDDGRFTDEVPEFQGQHVKAADPAIIAHLKSTGRMIKASQIVHSVPFCWRSDTPLIYKAVPSWFVRVESFRDRIVELNAETHWVPAHVKEKRFHNWLTEARDWAVSRNRYWGTPLPLWVSDDFEEVVCVGSIEELYELSGVRVDDLHRHHIDDITIPSRQGKGTLKRIPEVFDCWFESGSMPYAQSHYPFENAERFEAGFPADFIAEGLDQTRGWFYTLMVLSTALFDKPAFKNLIVNGLVLAADGKKMSKRLKNYPSPTLVVDQHGADALRLYLINSPVVRAEPLRFKEDGVRGVVRDVFLPWFHAFRFFVGSVARLEQSSGFRFVPDAALAAASNNIMDKWISASFNALIKFVREEMAAYRLYTVVPRLVGFIEQLTNWYVRLNRDRLKGLHGDAEALTSLARLYDVLMGMSLLMAPFTPFFTEFVYQRLRRMHPACDDEAAPADALGRAASVHFCALPEYDAQALDEAAEARMRVLQTVVELARVVRERNTISLKQPLPEIVVVSTDAVVAEACETLRPYILEEVNVVGLRCTADEEAWCTLSARPDGRALGRRFGRGFKECQKLIAAMSHADVARYVADGSITLGEFELGPGDLTVGREFCGDAQRYDAGVSDGGGLMVVLDVVQTPELVAAGVAREVVNNVQKLRKEAGLVPTDDVDVFVAPAPAKDALAACAANEPFVMGKLRVMPLDAARAPAAAVPIAQVTCDLGHIFIARPCVALAPTAGPEALRQPLASFVSCMSADYIRAQVQGGVFTVVVDGVEVALREGEDFQYRAF